MIYLVRGTQADTGKSIKVLVEAASPEAAAARATRKGISVASVTLQTDAAASTTATPTASPVASTSGTDMDLTPEPVASLSPAPRATMRPVQVVETKAGGGGKRLIGLAAVLVVLIVLAAMGGGAYWYFFSGGPIDGRRLLPDVSDATNVSISQIQIQALSTSELGKDFGTLFRPGSNINGLNFDTADMVETTAVTYSNSKGGHFVLWFRLAHDKSLADIVKTPAGARETQDGIDLQSFSTTAALGGPINGTAIARLSSGTYLLGRNVDDLKESLRQYQSGRKVTLPEDMETLRGKIPGGQIVTVAYTRNPFGGTATHANATSFKIASDVRMTSLATLDSADAAAKAAAAGQSRLAKEAGVTGEVVAEGNIVRTTVTATADAAKKLGGGF